MKTLGEQLNCANSKIVLFGIEETLDKIHSANMGERITYYIGDLYHNRQPHKNSFELSENDRAILNKLASAVYDLYREGRIHLCQKRVDDYTFEYIAEKADPRYAYKRSKYIEMLESMREKRKVNP